jgi:hypothetical protein
MQFLQAVQQQPGNIALTFSVGLRPNFNNQFRGVPCFKPVGAGTLGLVLGAHTVPVPSPWWEGSLLLAGLAVLMTARPAGGGELPAAHAELLLAVKDGTGFLSESLVLGVAGMGRGGV